MMHLFTEQETKDLQQALMQVKHKQKTCGLDQLHGFISGLVITPESINPTEWAAYVFKNTNSKAALSTQQQAALPTIQASVEKMRANTSPIIYPFQYTQPTGLQIKQMIEWCSGLQAALLLRGSFWLGNNDKNQTVEPEPRFQEMSFCFTSLRAITTPSDIPTLFGKQQGQSQDMPEEEQLRLFVKCLQGMPHLMQSLYRFTEQAR